MTRLPLLACAAALLLCAELPAQRAPDPGGPDSVCAVWFRTLRERGAAALRERLDRTIDCIPDEPTILQLWRTVRSDTAQLAPLAGLTGSVGGARVLHAVLRTLSDRRRPALVRVAAVVALVPYMQPEAFCAGRLLDTLRAPDLLCSVDHPSYRASSSIEPILRDSMRAGLRDAIAEGGALGRAAESLFSDWSGPERWSETRAPWCRRAGAAFEPALRMNAAVVMSDELSDLARCTETGPPALALVWRTVTDATTLTQLVRISAGVRDRRLYRALLAVARDSSRPTSVRVAAVDATAQLLHPALYWFQSGRSQVGPRGPCSVWGPFASHEAVQEEGAEPMGPASRRAGVAELVRLRDEGVPRPVADAARVVARCAEALLDSRPPQVW